MPWIDVTRPVSEELPVWPGDTPYQFELAWSQQHGQTVNVGALRATTHLGTHVDAPFHFVPEGAPVAALPLEPFLGPAVVVDASGHDLIGPGLLAGLDLAATPRVLLKTGGWPVGAPFPERIPVIEPETADYLAERGVLLLGVDVPSVDALESEALPNHHALARHGIQILESVALDGVPAGRYEFVALPLRLEGADASPVRALLRPLG